MHIVKVTFYDNMHRNHNQNELKCEKLWSWNKRDLAHINTKISLNVKIPSLSNNVKMLNIDKKVLIHKLWTVNNKHSIETV